ncbi:hypothetical protein LPU83_pLPU83d_0642 (plasmid) [Rhizobium favelukesii]|uniref:Uncharacterized protein n=1 Tax=Rhizobium favelukesii TaxID=348824 RepID=W6RTD0_9HYPH|nr:hypothetical protein LPU83_pLPU83d_0642 [Rhizobium favelukesii]
MHVGISEVQGSPKAMLRLLEAREELGRYCHEAYIDGLRVQRFLLPEDEPPAPDLDIQGVLARAGMTWDGGFEVEAAPGENAKLFTDACALWAWETFRILSGYATFAAKDRATSAASRAASKRAEVLYG